MYIYHIFFICSPIDGCLGCFLILAIVSAVMNFEVHGSFQISGVFFQIYTQKGLVVLFLVFWETSILFYIVAAPIYIPTNSVQRFLFLHILSKICYLRFCFVLFFLMIAILTGMRLYFVMVLICISLIFGNVSIFSYPYWPSLFLFWKNVCLVPLPVF